MTTTPSTRYVPALLTGGQVPLGRALAFLALCQEVTQAALITALDDSAARVPTPEADDAPGAHLRATVEDHTEALAPVNPLGPFTLFDAILKGKDPDGLPWAPRFAEVLVWAEASGATESTNTPAGFRAVTVVEASGPAFPMEPLAEAWSPFFSTSSKLTSALLGSQSASTSTSSTETTTEIPG